MKAYTVESAGRLVAGIAVQGTTVPMGIRPTDQKPLAVPIDPRATVRDGRLVEAPGRGALLVVRDQAGLFGSWHLRAAQPPERWDAMVATESIPNALDRILAAERVRAKYPHRPAVGWYEFARGTPGTAPTADGARARVDLYGYLEEGASFEIRRRGRLEGTPAVLLVSCLDGEVTVRDPRALAVARRQSLFAVAS